MTGPSNRTLLNKSESAIEPVPGISPGLRSVAIVALFFTSIGSLGCAVTGSKSGSGGNPSGGGTPAVKVTPDPVSFGTVTLGSMDSQTMQLSNPSTADLTVTKVQATGHGFFVTGLSLPLKLAAGRSTSFTGTFKPHDVGKFSGSISIISNAKGPPLVVNLSGAGTTSRVQLSPSTITVSFGNVTVGSSSTKDVELTNTGNTDVTITNVSVAGTGFVASGGTNVTLTPNQTTNVAVSFDPKAAGGVQGTLSITSNAPPLEITVTGQGTGQSMQHSVSLTWSPNNSVVVGYNVYRGTVSGGPYGRLNGSPDPSTSYTDQSVATGKTYYYVVTSIGTDSIESAYSSQVSAAIPTP
jgi:HYDIN/CFA65/VesB-like, Ig-like domain/Abnormal spindle-like microcephaly-assoc'd, ASPM-SPD-2-Hydin